MEYNRSDFNFFFAGKRTGKGPLGRPRHRWDDNMKIYIKEIGVNMRNRIDLAQDSDYWRALVNTA